ncbi:MAG: hypothetical protein P8Y53_19915 [Pseudolabrys sp.]
MAGMEPSAAAARRHDWGLTAIGVIFAGGGLYFVLVGAGLAPSPSKLYGPNWLALAVGLVFGSAGLSVAVRGWLAVPDHQAALPDDAPAAAVAVQWIASLVVIAGLASIASWIAFGPGERTFAMMLPARGTLGETVGRVAFGTGAVITWLMAIAVAARGVRKVFGKKG